MRKIIYLLFITILFLSCKEESKAEEVTNSPTKEVVVSEKETEASLPNTFYDVFTVSLDVKINKGDYFHLYYITNIDKNYDEVKSKWLKVDGLNEYQQVSFVLPKEAKPIAFRLDLGKDQIDNQFLMRNIIIGFKDKNITLKKDEYLEYFTPNDCIEIFKDGTVNLKQAVSNNQTVFIPVLMPTDLLQQDIKSYIY